jgi:pyruvate kinase
MKKAKMVCTLGPASNTPKVIGALIAEGMDVARINRSHGDISEDEALIKIIRDEAALQNKTVGILVDLQGPKIRLATFKNGDAVFVKKGDTFTITTEDVEGTTEKAGTTFKGITKDVKPGQTILIDDGKLSMLVKEVTKTDVVCEVLVSGFLSDHKGINLPGTIITLPALTKKDEADLRWALNSDVDMIAMSFVRRADDVKQAKKVMADEGVKLPIIAKIEKSQAVEDIDNIVKAFDGIMVARGDLGVEIPYQEVPLIQKRIIRKCRKQSKPVIVATQALESMITYATPTRAEVSDVANSILDGADATMTSGETAVGKYPVETIQAMARIVGWQTEEGLKHIVPLGDIEETEASAAMTAAASKIAEKINAKFIVTFTESGYSARTLSRMRGSIPVIALAKYQRTANFLALSWGIQTHLVDHYDNTDAILRIADKKLIELGYGEMGDVVVVLFGSPVGLKGSTNSIVAHKIGTKGIIDYDKL